MACPWNHPAAQSLQAPLEQGVLPLDEHPQLFQVCLLLQGGQSGPLGHAGHPPGLAHPGHVFQQRTIGAQAIPQAQACHGVALGKSPEHQQVFMGGNLVDQAMLLRVGQKIQKTLVHRQKGAVLGTALQNLQQQGAARHLSGGVVWFT